MFFGFSVKQIGTAVGIGIILLIILISFSGNGSQTQPTGQSIQLPTEQSTEHPTEQTEQQTKPSATQTAENEGVLVTRVIDGDTIEIEGGARVRYIGIDTPETVDPRKSVQCFGVEASNRNKQLVEGKRVRLEKDISETDKYGRLLRYVYVGDNFVNLTLVQEGYSYSYTYPPDVKYQDQFVEAQRTAREQNKGLWGSCPATPEQTQEPVTTSTPPPTQTSSSCDIKGNISSSGEKIYHAIGCGSYNQTKIDEARGERWFCSEAEALDAGWRKAKNC